MMKKYKLKNVISKNLDFLKVDPNDLMYENVKGIIVDPSCSGSGLNRELDQNDEKDRLLKLKNLQIMLVKHAMKCNLIIKF
jgi:25S rRNA (cytosine2278-C5)-methyltransferase